MSQVKSQVAGFSFDGFYLDARNRRLSRGGEPIPLNSRYFDVLSLLVARHGELVEKQHIFDLVWDGVFVTDSALTQCIKEIRKQLGDDASNPQYIKTVPKHGYIFIAAVIESAPVEIEVSGAFSPTAGFESGTTTGIESRAAAGVPGLSARPYKFLDYYTEHDVALFFGRESEVTSICSQILAHRSFILHGRSGVGKSSILRAGLMPRLKEAGHLVFSIRSFTDPLHQMALSLAQCEGLKTATGGACSLEALVEGAARSFPDRFVIFFLDQFEEFFTLLDEQSRQQFTEKVAALAQPASTNLRLVFALREDYLSEMSRLKSAIPEIYHHEYRLKRLSRGQATQAIIGPALAVGCEYDPALVTRILDDLCDRDSVDPPQLQIVCDILYDYRDSSGKLSLAIYESLGTAQQLLASYLERVLRRFNSSDLSAAKAILTNLITSNGQRLILRAGDLGHRVKGVSQKAPENLGHLIEELVAARVVRRRSQEGESWLELAHDFLTPEVSKWLTAEDRALKQARGIIERAMENFQAHELMIDADALDLLLPFGEHLGLAGEEADLLVKSILNRTRTVPGWLIASAPGATRLIAEAAGSGELGVRLSAIEACRLAPGDETKRLLSHLALWDADLSVRKAATIELADWFQGEAASVLSEESGEARVGVIRRAISLAMMRDYNKRLVQLSSLPATISILVVLGLMWVRLRRGGADILRSGLGGMAGGAVSGLIGGILLGVGLASTTGAAAREGAELTMVLASLGTFIGAIGALGVSFCMSAASQVAYRHSRWWSVVGAASGGAILGGSSNLLGIDTMKALFGQGPSGLTGALEGAAIGAGAALGAVLAERLFTRARSWQKVLAAGAGSMCAGFLLTIIGGNLFSASLEIVARSFAQSQLRMDPLAPLFGEVHFGQTTQLILGAIEGLMFGCGLMAGMELASRQPRGKSS